MVGGFSLIQELVRGGLTCIATFIGFWLALRSYRYNQWWDTRRQTYQKAVQVLFDCSCAFKKRTSLSRIDFTKNPNKRGELQDAERACHKVADDLERLIHEGVFNMSTQALGELHRTIKVIRQVFKGVRQFTFSERWEKACHEIAKLEKGFAIIAKDDLKVSPFAQRKRRQMHQYFSRVRKIWVTFWMRTLQPLLLTIWLGESKAKQLLARR